MTPETLKQVLDALEKNGAQALDGIAANAAMRAWGDLFLVGLMVILTAATTRLCIWLWKRFHAAGYNNEGPLAVAMVFSVAAVLSVIFLLVGIFQLPESVATIRNPRAAAIRILLQR